MGSKREIQVNSKKIIVQVIAVGIKDRNT